MTIDTRKHSRHINDVISEILDRGARGVVATLVDSGSTETLVGAKLIIRESGERTGGLGWLELDDAAARHAPVFLATSDEARTLRVSDFAPDLATDLAPDAGAIILFERLEPEPRLVIAGAGHVGASLARLAALVGFQVTLVDDRAEFLERDSFATKNELAIELVIAENWQNAMRQAIGNGRGVSVAIVTRGHKQDEDCLRAAVETRPDYVGMIGSKRRTNIVLEKLREEGADESELKRVRAPIGLDIGAVSPEEVALAILAEIVAERRGGASGSLSSWRRK